MATPVDLGRRERETMVDLTATADFSGSGSVDKGDNREL